MEKRYQRNILIDGFGEEGQQKLREAKVLVVGAGGLGSPVLLYLAAAGVGTLGIIDYDVIDETNLQRQILHHTGDIGRLKTASAHEKLSVLNPRTGFNIYQEKFTAGNAERLVGEYDFVVDCCDNYATKLLINDACVSRRKPYSHGAVIAMRGEVMTYVPGTACYRCVFDDPPEDGGILPASSQIGILGAVAGIAGSIQAAETVKYLAGLGGLITNQLLIIDAKSMNFFSLKVKANGKCLCQEGEATD